MKVSTFAFATILTFTSFVVATADARDGCTGFACKDYPKTSATFDIARQYANGGQFGGVTSGATATTLDVARDSVDFFGAPQLYASPWRVPPAVAKGD
jgi:hypothetical protein